MARILVIDDELEIRVVLQNILKVYGHQVELAADGAEGLVSFGRTMHDLVIIDIFMPEHDGIEAIGLLRRQFPEVPIIAISGHGRAAVSLDVVRHLGVGHVLQKPFSADELMSAVAGVMKQKFPHAVEEPDFA